MTSVEIRSLRSVGLCVALLFGVGREAAAQTVCAERARVDALEEEGQTLRRAHRDAEALQRFEQAWNLCHEPRSLIRRGLAEWALGRWIDAEAHVVEGLSHRDDPWVRANQEALNRQDLPAIRANLGSIELAGSGGQGEVRIGGRRAAAWPSAGPIRAVRGENVVEVAVAGFHPWRRSVNVPAGGLAREQVELVALSRPAPPEPARPSVANTPTPHPTPDPAPAPPMVDRGSSGTLRALAWTGTALTLAAGATALATWMIHNDATDEFGPTSLPTNPDPNTRYCISPLANQVTECQSIASRRDTMGTLAAVTGITAGALAVGTVVLWVQAAQGSRSTQRASRAVGCAPTFAGVGLHCALSF